MPWWPEDGRELTLHRALVHVIVDIHRHAGHADLVRELIDGAIGADRRWSNLPPGDEAWWASYRDRVEAAARHAGRVTELRTLEDRRSMRSTVTCDGVAAGAFQLSSSAKATMMPSGPRA